MLKKKEKYIDIAVLYKLKQLFLTICDMGLPLFIWGCFFQTLKITFF